MIKQVQRYWHCDCCGAVVDHFRYKYDWTPDGEDVSVCPECGVDAGFVEVEEKHWKIKKISHESAGIIYELKCIHCGNCETVSSYPWPKKCYLCERDMT